MEYFVDRVLSLEANDSGNYLAIYNADKLRYLINIEKGNAFYAKRKLSENIAAYSSKLGILMKLLKWIPSEALACSNFARIVSIDIDSEIQKAVDVIAKEKWPGKTVLFNIIVGNYAEKQKIVLQCFCPEAEDDTFYLKVGDEHAKREMSAETNYLMSPIITNTFVNPQLCYHAMQDEGYRYNIQGTKEFKGETLKPQITSQIIEIYHSISNSSIKVDSETGEKLYFSHGDFTPWNIKKTADSYIVFDWEYCDYRFYGFDIIHFLWQIENKLNKKDPHSAFVAAVTECKKWDPALCCYDDRVLEKKYLTELHKQFGDIL